MVKELVLPAQLIQHWAPLLLPESKGVLTEQQKQDVLIFRNAQRIIDVASSPDFDVVFLREIFHQRAYEGNAVHQIDHALATIFECAEYHLVTLGRDELINDFQKTLFEKIKRAAQFIERTQIRLFYSKLYVYSPSRRNRIAIFQARLFNAKEVIERAVSGFYKRQQESVTKIHVEIEPNLPSVYAFHRSMQSCLEIILEGVAQSTQTSVISLCAFVDNQYIHIAIKDGLVELHSIEVSKPILSDEELSSASHTSHFCSNGYVWVEHNSTVYVRLPTSPAQVRRTLYYNVPRRKFKTHTLEDHERYDRYDRQTNH